MRQPAPAPVDWSDRLFAAIAAVAVAVAAAHVEQLPELCLAVGPLYAMFSDAGV